MHKFMFKCINIVWPPQFTVLSVNHWVSCPEASKLTVVELRGTTARVSIIDR